MAEIASGSIDLKSLKIASEPNKYITRISENGISIHPENNENNGVNITDHIEMIQNGQIIAKYGSNIIVGNENTFHIKMGVWYKLTEDITVNLNKTYYIKTEISSGNYEYIVVENPTNVNIRTYYEQMPQELGFYDRENKVAYIRNDRLFINQSVVVSQMDVGLKINPAEDEPAGNGQWSWKVHENSENPPRNNLYLKWIG